MYCGKIESGVEKFKKIPPQMKAVLAVVDFLFILLLLFVVISGLWGVNNDATAHLTGEDVNEGEDTAAGGGRMMGESGPSHSNPLSNPLSAREILTKNGYELLMDKESDDPGNVSIKWGDLSESGMNLLVSNFDSVKMWISYSVRPDETLQDPSKMPSDEDIGMYKNENKDEDIAKGDINLIGFILAMNFYVPKGEDYLRVMTELDPDEICEMILAIDFLLPTDRETILRELAVVIRLSRLNISDLDMKIFKDIMSVIRTIYDPYDRLWNEEKKKLTILNLDTEDGLEICENLWIFNNTIEILDIKFADYNEVGARKLSDAINSGWLKNLQELHIPGIPKTSLFDHIYDALSKRCAQKLKVLNVHGNGLSDGDISRLIFLRI